MQEYGIGGGAGGGPSMQGSPQMNGMNGGSGIPSINPSHSASALGGNNGGRYMENGSALNKKSLIGVGTAILGPSRSNVDLAMNDRGERNQSDMIRAQNIDYVN